MSSSSALERRTVHFEGNVQGVGFRFSTHNISRGYPVTGYVRNLADGRVQLVAEGTSDVLNQFIQQVSRELEAYIQNSTIDRQAASGEFRSFEIRH